MPAQKNYGSRGQHWHPDFVTYMNFIASHPSYAGMPDAFVDGGKIQWEAPSNRGGGRFKDTHHLRRDWWRAKARAMGISPESQHWISKCAKRLHPTGRKPCKRCGRVLELRYIYPGKILLARIIKLPCLAADRLMGIVRTNFRASPCRNGHPGPCDADHIGPISLGFTHRPEFQMLCKACNSAKNNRMNLADVAHLRRLEAVGTEIISWHSNALWNLRKGSVVDDESALRLSKLLRDNRHTFMAVLQQVEQAGRFGFLLFLLNLEFADFEVEFVDLIVTGYLTVFATMTRTPRTTKYAIEQKARRCRVALRALHDYFAKANRSAYVISTPASEQLIKRAVDLLATQPDAFRRLDAATARLLNQTSDDDLEAGLRTLVTQLPVNWPSEFLRAKELLGDAMTLAAIELARRWDDERYVRAESAFD